MSSRNFRHDGVETFSIAKDENIRAITESASSITDITAALTISISHGSISFLISVSSATVRNEKHRTNTNNKC